MKEKEKKDILIYEDDKLLCSIGDVEKVIDKYNSMELSKGLKYLNGIRADILNYYGDEKELKIQSEMENLLNSEIKTARTLLNIYDIISITIDRDEKKSDNNKTKNKKEYKLVFNESMESDLKLLQKAGLCKWDGKGKPDFNNMTLLLVLFQYWKISVNHQQFESGNIKHPYINHNFLINGKNPKIKTYDYTSVGYNTNKEKALHSLSDVLKLNEKEIDRLKDALLISKKSKNF